MKPKIIVRYLPQFHRTKENDEWWGEGFTEWTTVRKGKSLYNGHLQPREPLNGNYYNLLDKNTMKWQADLARKYGIDGFAFYHYWFKDGKQILERPAENLLKWKDIDMPFCFCWANETWSRTWSNLMNGNVWAGEFEQKSECNDNGILLDQKYGLSGAWIDHIKYLIPFFQDKRYIKHNGKPVFMIYHPEEMHCLPDMLDCWQEILNENGIEGIYVIAETQNECISINRYIDSRVIRFPDSAIQQMNTNRLENGLRVYDYDEYWKKLLSCEWNWIDNEKTYICAAVNFDTTPRKGTAGIVLKDGNPQKFKKYFQKLYCMEKAKNNEYVFINAWNEWGEGAYLEPDTSYKYGYLQAIYDVVNANDFYAEDIKVENYTLREKKMMPRWVRDNHAMKAFSKWLLLKENNKKISDYLLSYGIKTVAIYGYGYLGKHLVEELNDSDVCVKYIIDRNTGIRARDIEVLRLSKDLPKVDVIIVTPAGQYDEIRSNIKTYVSYNTLSLEHILSEMV